MDSIIISSEAVPRKEQQEENAGCSQGKPIPLQWALPKVGEEKTTPDHVYQASIRLVQAGISVIPIEAEMGSKAPVDRLLPRPIDRTTGLRRPSWKAFQCRRPYPAELDSWHNTCSRTCSRYGLAVINGVVSGGLEVIDFDTASLADPWLETVEKQAPGLIARLVRVQTPRPGLHVYYRCPVIGASQKLALVPEVDELGGPVLDRTGVQRWKAAIETKGEGGYSLIPPSPPRCHPSGRLYTYLSGSPELSEVPTIAPAEREILLEAARALSQCKEPIHLRTPGYRKPSLLTNRPSHRFNASATWEDVLIPHGWTLLKCTGHTKHWTRPGKADGISATTNFYESDELYVFSTNADPFESQRSYSKFDAFALLTHNGDIRAAAKAIRLIEKQGE